MNINQKRARIIGLLLLFVFISGVVIFQFLQGPVLFADDFITKTAEKSNKVIGSVLLGICSGMASISIAVLFYPLFKKISPSLAYIYIALSIVNFVSIAIDNVSVITILELSKQYVENGNSLTVLENLVYERHWWTHYLFLLISCFPTFVLYYGLYAAKLVPKVISVFGMIATLLMFTEEIASIFGNSISMNMLLPIGLIQFILPIWLLLRGFSKENEHVYHEA